MPIIKYSKVSTVIQNKAQRQDNTWAIALKEKPN